MPNIDYPLPYTLLSLEEWRDIMGVPPPHFWSGAGSTYFPVMSPDCTGIWWKYPWQDNNIASRQELADAILRAEQELADYLGWWPAPIWISEEHQNYPQHFKRSLVGLGRSVSGGLKTVKANYGKFINGGVRATTLIDDDVAVAYSDEDGDGYDETATITVATTVAIKEVKVYFVDTDAEQGWEIRYPRKVSASGGNVTLVFWAWQLLDPDLQEAYPTIAGMTAIDIEAAASYVTTVDVYREYNDTTTRSASFSWGRLQCAGCGGTGCEACNPTVQTGCVHSVDEFAGVLMPQPANYGTSSWQAQEWTDCVEPTQVDLWYYSGNVSERYKRDGTTNPLDRNLAQAIAYLAVGRLPSPPCSCGGGLLQVLQNDLALTEDTRNSFRFTIKEVEENPFGTTVADLMAWRIISKIREINFDVALV